MINCGRSAEINKAQKDLSELGEGTGPTNTVLLDGIIFQECEVSLVKELQIEIDKFDYQYEEGEYLTTAADDFEADLLASLLMSEGIHIILKHRGITQYLKVIMGSSNFGVDIRVPKKQLDKAKEILESRPVDFEDEEEISKEMDQLLDKNKKTRGRIITSILLVFHVPGIVLSLIIN